MIIVCRRCGQHFDGEGPDDVYAWRDTHLCMMPARVTMAERLRPVVHPDLPHGDWRRFRSMTQRCECDECHAAYLEHDYDMRN